MTEKRADEMIRILNEIEADQAADAENFDGKPFNGRTVAEYFGNHCSHGKFLPSLSKLIYRKGLADILAFALVNFPHFPPLTKA